MILFIFLQLQLLVYIIFLLGDRTAGAHVHSTFCRLYMGAVIHTFCFVCRAGEEGIGHALTP